MKKLKLEAGKHYLTRMGEKVYIDAIADSLLYDGSYRPFPALGLFVQSGLTGWWSLGGKTIDSYEHRDDIVAEDKSPLVLYALFMGDEKHYTAIGTKLSSMRQIGNDHSMQGRIKYRIVTCVEREAE